MTIKPRTIIIFQHIADTMKAEYVLKKAGYPTDVIVPPVEMCECCELGLMIDPAEQDNIKAILDEKRFTHYHFSQITS